MFHKQLWLFQIQLLWWFYDICQAKTHSLKKSILLSVFPWDFYKISFLPANSNSGSQSPFIGFLTRFTIIITYFEYSNCKFQFGGKSWLSEWVLRITLTFLSPHAESCYFWSPPKTLLTTTTTAVNINDKQRPFTTNNDDNNERERYNGVKKLGRETW